MSSARRMTMLGRAGLGGSCGDAAARSREMSASRVMILDSTSRARDQFLEIKNAGPEGPACARSDRVGLFRRIVLVAAPPDDPLIGGGPLLLGDRGERLDAGGEDVLGQLLLGIVAAAGDAHDDGGLPFALLVVLVV